MNKLYVGNLVYQVSEGDLRNLLSSCGEIADLRLITDRDTGRSKGFAFVTFADSAGKEAALKLNGQDYQGRPLRINEAEDRGGGNGGGNGGRGGRGGNGGGGGGRPPFRRREQRRFHDE